MESLERLQRKESIRRRVARVQRHSDRKRSDEGAYEGPGLWWEWLRYKLEGPDRIRRKIIIP